MRTPAGKECSYFYGDYYRGRDHEECRLLGSTSPPLPWKPALCADCPVPGIEMANACKHMILIPRLSRTLPLFKKQVQVQTRCSKSGASGFDPHTGCGHCHELPGIFEKSLDGSDSPR